MLSKLFSAKRSYRPRKESFLIARSILVMAVVSFGAFTVSDYGLSLWPVDRFLAVFTMTVFAISALVTPVIIPIAIRSAGSARWALFFVALVFSTIDTIGLAKAFQGFETRVTEPQYQSLLSAYEHKRAHLLERISAQEKKRDAVVFPQHEMTSRQEVALVAYQTQIAPFERSISKANIELQSIVAPERPSLFDARAIMFISFLLQLALAVVFGAIEATRERRFQKAERAWKEELQERRDDRKREEKNERARRSRERNRRRLQRQASKLKEGQNSPLLKVIKTGS